MLWTCFDLLQDFKCIHLRQGKGNSTQEEARDRPEKEQKGPFAEGCDVLLVAPDLANEPYLKLANLLQDPFILLP